jgi:glycosyltransferase involved in cell wall biosynthesis
MSDASGPKLLVLDSSFSLEAIRAQGLEESITCRDLQGFFAHVWTVHPFATLVTSARWAPRHGLPARHVLSERHTFIEGKVARFKLLDSLPALNFLIAQLSLSWRLVRLIRKERISVIRAGDPLYLGLLAWVLARCCGIPYVVRVGGNNDKVYEVTGRPLMPRLFGSRRTEKVVEHFVLSRADLVAGANQDNLAFALANGANPEKSTLFRYGNLISKHHLVPPEERQGGAKLLEELGLESHRYLLYIGRLEPIKHPDHVVRALADVRERGYRVRAVLAGDGSMRGELEALARELQVEDHVLFCGNVSQEWLAQLIPLAAVVVSPHTGRALSEAALGGAPIVAYDIDWQSEVVKMGATGILVPFQALGEMVNGIERFLADRDYAAEMGAAVRNHAVSMMDVEALNAHERTQYKRLLGLPFAPNDAQYLQRGL